MKHCRDFQRGDCKYGSRCKFSHERGGPSSEADKVDTWGRVDPSAPFKPWNTSGFKNRDKDRDKGGETPSGGAYNSDDTVRIWCRPNAKSFVTSMQMRRFIQACSNSVQTSSNEILDNICGGDRTGLDRITEICQCDFEVDAGPNFQKFSFQRIIVAMLKFVTDPKLSNSVLRRSVNNILNVITENLDLEQVEECLRIMEERKSIADRKMTHIDPEFWGPKSWDDLVLPISSYCEKVIPQTQAKQTSEEMLKLISRLRSIAQNVPGVGRKFKEQVQYLQKQCEQSISPREIDPSRKIPAHLAEKLLKVVEVEDDFKDVQPDFFDGFRFACRKVDFLVMKAFNRLRKKVPYKDFYNAFQKALFKSFSHEQRELIWGVCQKFTPEYEHIVLTRSYFYTSAAIFEVALKRPREVQKNLNATQIQEKNSSATQIEKKNLNATQTGEKNLSATQIDEKNLNSNQIEENNLNATQIEQKSLIATQTDEKSLNSIQIEGKNLNAAQIQEKNLKSNQIEEKNLNTTQIDEKKINSNKIEEKDLNVTQSRIQQFILQMMNGIKFNFEDQDAHVQGAMFGSDEFKRLKIIRLQFFGSKNFNVDFGEWFFENILKFFPGFEDSKLDNVFILWDFGYRYKNARNPDYESLYLMVRNFEWKEIRQSEQIFEAKFVEGNNLKISLMSEEFSLSLLERYLQFIQWPDLKISNENKNVGENHRQNRF